MKPVEFAEQWLGRKPSRDASVVQSDFRNITSVRSILACAGKFQRFLDSPAGACSGLARAWIARLLAHLTGFNQASGV
jgi:hypothetical protein